MFSNSGRISDKGELVKFIRTLVTGEVVIPPAPAGFKQFILIPTSSGIDSTAVAIVMALLYPAIPVVYVFTDTGNEVTGTKEALDKLEAFTARKIIRMTPKRSLVERALDQGSFIPSQRARWCTQQFKALPFKRFVQGLRELHGDKTEFISLVGVRADEPTRTGIEWSAADAIKTVFPLQQLGLGKTEVNQIVNAVLGLPTYYAHKSRSGCEICIYSRRSEIIAMSQVSPGTFELAAKSEQLPKEYQDKLRERPQSVSAATGISRNWLRYPVPSVLDGSPSQPWETGVPTMRRNQDTLDLFSAGNQTYFVAVEHHFGVLGVTHQKLVNYSSSLAGLKKSLKFHSLHRQQTGLIWGESTAADVRDSMRLSIYAVELTDADRRIPQKPKGVFTWQNDGRSLDEIQKTTYLLEQSLLVAGLQQDALSTDVTIAETATQALQRISVDFGQVLHGSMYDTPALNELLSDIDIEDAPVMCNACAR
jgi:3'-phosphoadenosine 5'-phosphosulfate sulfotransferase (PAPS reductase)/FAD synthetase